MDPLKGTAYYSIIILIVAFSQLAPDISLRIVLGKITYPRIVSYLIGKHCLAYEILPRLKVISFGNFYKAAVISATYIRYLIAPVCDLIRIPSLGCMDKEKGCDKSNDRQEKNNDYHSQYSF